MLYAIFQITLKYGNGGKHGDVKTAIKWTIEALNRACA